MQPTPRGPAKATTPAEALAAEIRRGFGAAEAEARIAFAAELYSRAGAAYAAELSDDARVAIASSAFDFFAGMEAPVRCRAVNPALGGDGRDFPFTIVESHLVDRPFIVDTVRMSLEREGAVIRHLLHPIVPVERTFDGRLLQVGSADPSAGRESFVHCALDRLSDEDLPRLERGLAERLGDLQLATDDYAKMLERLEAVRREAAAKRARVPGRTDEIDDLGEFLFWLAGGGFVFLGARSYTLVREGRRLGLEVDRGSGLGILRKEDRSHYAARRWLDELSPGVAERIRGGPLLIVARTGAESTVHRPTRMDYVGVKRIDEKGRLAGEHRFLGLFTSKAYAEEAAEMPILRRKLNRILAAEQVLRGTHDYKAIVAIFNSIPKTELLTLSEDELRADIRAIMSIQRSDEIRVTLRPDALGRGLSAMVVLPSGRFSDEVRRDVELLLEKRSGGTAVDSRVALGEGDHARIHLFLATPESVPLVRAADVEREITDLVRSWDDRLRERITAEMRGARGRKLAERYLEIFTDEYRASTDVSAAVADIARLEELAKSGAMQVELADGPGGEAERLATLKLYLRDQDIVLSDFLPLLENLGLRVFAEDSVDLRADGRKIFLHRFEVRDARERPLDVPAVGPLLAAALVEVRGGRAESDPLDRLVVRARLTGREVDCLRTYRNLAFQAGAAPSRKALGDVLVEHPAAARALFECFAARFGGEEKDRAQRVEAARARFVESLDAVATSGEDRMLRTYLALVEATVRTNFYRPPRADHPFIAVKIHSQALEFFPRPRPLYEIYVHSARMEGVHLRGGKVARGGIRASDRHDDFRTEILGLMKTQMVKNAVIVPSGAKGGFIVKRLPPPGEPRAAEIRECYSTLMRGLLELTDNVVRGRIVPPDAVRRYDGDDPYLVVAADKGTAAFSDLANSIAREHGFWLGDAFASGGSQGYDHKREGITARGAWECVQTHFRELGRDLLQEPFTVVAIGDMSGDVFGNGMLWSRKIRLRAAFNHEHVFLDPSPDPEASFQERERLFRLPRSQWTDYDRRLLSPGGAVVPRSSKAVNLSPEIRAMLGVEAESLDGEGLVRAVLSMECDLLFNGGIGTYVRASSETNAEVGDAANDQVRIPAAALRATAAGEGGNLGFTQRARIEYALRGGRINTDAIDNSGGVDLSDHEVNLKILFQPLVEAGKLTLASRRRILEQVKPDVVAHVLEHNARQSWLLALDQQRSRTRLVEFRDHMADLGREGVLDRLLEALPDREALRVRRSVVLGLTRPELAVLAAYSKISLQRRLLASAWIEEPALEGQLASYFPPAVAERFADAVRAHRLRREIVAIQLTNRVVDRMGAAFTQRMLRDTGADPATAVAASTVVFAITEADRLFDAIAASAIRFDAAAEQLLRWEASVESACKFLVRTPGLMTAIGDTVERLRRPLAEIADLTPDVAPPALQAEAAREEKRLEELGLASGLARSLVGLSALRSSLEIVAIAAAGGASLRDAAFAYHHAAPVVDFAGVERWLDAVPADDRWEKRAAEGLREDLAAARRAVTLAVLARAEASVAERLQAFAAARESDLAKLRVLGEDVLGSRKASLGGVVVLVRELGRLGS